MEQGWEPPDAHPDVSVQLWTAKRALVCQAESIVTHKNPTESRWKTQRLRLRGWTVVNI